MDKPLEFFDRYSGKIRREAIYGEDWLRWSYGTLVGRLVFATVVKRALFSSWYGWRMKEPASREKIVPFCRDYGIDTSEFEEAVEEFRSFNDFFIRRLEKRARPVTEAEKSVVFPVDGRHLGFPDTGNVEGIYAKGQRFDLPSLVGDADCAERYWGGVLVISRLSPIDCHRFHFPVAGLPGGARLIWGCLSSVNPLALRENIRILFENKRYVTKISSTNAGEVLFIEIGATCVGSVRQTYPRGERVEKGAEKGYFEFGGSAVITLFEPGRIELAEDLRRHSEAGVELYARMGDVMGFLAP